MTIAIDRIRLSLPAALGGRAHCIAQAIADALGTAAHPPMQLAALQLPPLQVDAAASDAQIGRLVGAQLQHALAAQRSAR